MSMVSLRMRVEMKKKKKKLEKEFDWREGKAPKAERVSVAMKEKSKEIKLVGKEFDWREGKAHKAEDGIHESEGGNEGKKQRNKTSLKGILLKRMKST